MKFYDEREKKHRYRRVAIGPTGKIIGGILLFISLASVILMQALFGGPRFESVSEIIIHTLGMVILLTGFLLLFVQKRVTVDFLAGEVTVESGMFFSMKILGEYDIKDVTAVVVYALKFGLKKTRNLYAAAIQTKDKKLVIFNPGVPDAQKNMKIAGILAELLGVPILAGKVSEGKQETVAVPVALCALERNGGKEVLLIRRTGPPFEGMWGLPGGKVNSGETAPEASARELREETGYAPKYVTSFGIVSEEIVEEGAPYRWVIIHLFGAEAEEIHQKNEVETELMWRSREKIEKEPADVIPSDLKMLNEMIFKRRPGYVKARIEKTPDGYKVTRFEFSGAGVELPPPRADAEK